MQEPIGGDRRHSVPSKAKGISTHGKPIAVTRPVTHSFKHKIASYPNLVGTSIRPPL
jgi:hypothetical protein